MDSGYLIRLQEAYSQVSASLKQDPDLVTRLQKLHDYGCQMSSFAHEYDFREVKSNGFRVALEFIIRLLRYGHQHYKGHADQHYSNMVDIFVAAIPYFKNLRQNTKNTKCLIDPSIEQLSRAFLEYFDKNGMDAGFGPLVGFNYDYPENWVCYLLYFGIRIVAPGSLAGSFRAIFDPEFARDCIRREYNNMTVDHLKWIDLTADNWYVRRVAPVLTFGFSRPWIRKTVFIPRQGRYKILCDIRNQTCDLVQHESNVISSEKLRCRLQFDTSKEPNGTVVMNVHGGGFVIGSADNHECYTRSWSIAMPGVAFLSVDYDLSPESQFPGPLQQILDAYLFLQTTKAKCVIGYRPRQVLLIGDSSGGLIITAMTCILNDLRKRFPDSKADFKMPIAIIALYPSFSCVPLTTPSMLLSGIHAELPFPAFLTMISAYVPFHDQNLNNVMRTDYAHKSSTKLSFIWEWLTGPAIVREKRNDIWWNQSPELTRKRLSDWKLIQHPYVSPLLYDDHESMREVSLSVFACATDPILDQAVEMCKKWRGGVQLHVWEDVLHAFLTQVGFGGKYEAYNKQVIHEIKRLTKYKE